MTVKMKKYHDFLIRMFRKIPTKKEMQDINKRMNYLNKTSKGEQSNKKVCNLYNKELSAYWEKIVAYEDSGEEVKLLLKNVNLGRDSRILSLASGIGVFEMFIAKEVADNGKIICVDFSSEMIKIANKIKNRIGVKNLSILLGSIEKLDVKDNSQDIVLARRTGLSDQKIWLYVLNEVRRVLKDENSRFIYTVSEKCCDSKKEIIKKLDNSGLKLLKISSFKEKDVNKIMMIICVRKE